MNDEAAIGSKPNSKRETLTYSALSKFRNCRRAYRHRYVDELSQKDKGEALWVGSAFHDALHVGYLEREQGKSRDEALEGALRWMDAGPLLGANADPALQGRRDLLRAMVRNYEYRWREERPEDSVPDSALEEIAKEMPFVLPIRNPETGRQSMTFQLAGKVDGIVRFQDQLFILEHKTAATISGDYLARLWADFQSQIYAASISELLGEPVVGVIYDVTAKARLKRKKGETSEEFAERIAGYKTEKTKKKHLEIGPKQDETEEQISARLDAWYQNPDAFVRELIYFDADTLANVKVEIWELTQQILDARRRDRWGQNTTQCYAFGSCAYAPICRNHGKIDETVEIYYEKKASHEELREVLPAGYSPSGDDIFAELDKIEASQDSGRDLAF